MRKRLAITECYVLRMNSSTTAVNVRSPNIYWVVTIFEFLIGSFIYIHVSGLIVFVVTLYEYSYRALLFMVDIYTTCELGIHDVRSSHIVSIRTGLTSRII